MEELRCGEFAAVEGIVDHDDTELVFVEERIATAEAPADVVIGIPDGQNVPGILFEDFRRRFDHSRRRIRTPQRTPEKRDKTANLVSHRRSAHFPRKKPA